MRRTPANERYVEPNQVIALLGIEPLLDRRPARLSGGEKQRVAIGRALLSSPRMLLMDEPLAALDAARKAEILPFVERLHAEITIPIIYVSHAVDEVLRIADTVAVVRDGGIEAVGPVENLASRLDLSGQAGFGEAGTVLAATVARHDDAHALTELDTAAGRIYVGRLDAPVDARTRLRLRARDIALALEAPRQASFLNVLEGTVASMETRASGAVEVAVEIHPDVRIWAEVTKLAAERLALAPGTAVHVLIKSVAVERYLR
jgi:molybdate transport system ATP-binding protein